jgi:hypothetical protein
MLRNKNINLITYLCLIKEYDFKYHYIKYDFLSRLH